MKTHVAYWDGTLLDQVEQRHLIRFGQVESRLSQTLSEEVKNCHKEGSNSRR